MDPSLYNDLYLWENHSSGSIESEFSLDIVDAISLKIIVGCNKLLR